MMKTNINAQVQQAKFFADVNGLEGIKSGARQNSKEAIQAAAEQFEAMFFQMIMKNMHAANKELRSDLFASNATDHYMDMYHQQLAQTLAESGDLGLGKVLTEQLSQTKPATETNKALTGTLYSLAHYKNQPETFVPIKIDSARIFSLEDYRPNNKDKLMPLTENTNIKANEAIIENIKQQTQTRLGVKKPEETKDYAAASHKAKRFTSAAEFAQVMLPYAKTVADELGIDPKVLVAQAALETGWGRSIIQGRDGVNSHNLFGIKAHRWQGDEVYVATHEYRGGQRAKEMAAFRRYDSYEHSFNDYVDFLRTNPRYKNALANVHSPESFTKELQRAGYATDPYYARKILKLYNSDAIQNASL